MNKIKTIFSEKQKGFSLVEVMIIVAIIAISTAVVLRGQDTTRKTKNEIEMEGRKFMATVNSQKNDAIAGKKADGVVGACVYSVNVLTANLGQYVVLGCNPTTQTLSSGVTFNTAVNKEVNFTSPMANVKVGAVDLNPVSTVDFILGKDGINFTVSVSGAGEIKGSFN